MSSWRQNKKTWIKIMRMGLRSLRRMSRRKKEILIRSLTSGTRISIGLIIIQKITLTSIRTMILIHLIH